MSPGRVERGLQLLRSDQVLKGQSGKAVTAALYLRYLKTGVRPSEERRHISGEPLPPNRLQGEGERGGRPSRLGTLEEADVMDELEEMEGDESRD